MARPPIIADLPGALSRREFPTITIWNRLEGRPRTVEFDRALRAEVRDPLWMLARQWQLGEFRGDDGGSPVTATAHLRTTRPTRYQAGDAPPASLPDRQPLEAVVEARTVPFALEPGPVRLDLRLAMGRRWLKLMSRLPTAVQDRIAARWPIAAPDPESADDVQLVAHPEVWATLQAVAGRVMDGYELYRHLKTGGHPYDGVTGIDPQQQLSLDELVFRFLAWFDDLLTQPSGPEAFDPARLEHHFSVAAPEAAGETVLAAAEFPGGTADWHAFSYDGSGTSLGTADGPDTAGTVTRTVVPGEVRFAGMPNPRWWSFEDGRTDFGALDADSTDLVKLLFLEFALVYSDDWFLLPCDLEEGTLCRVDGVVVTDVFGRRSWIEPAGTGVDDDWQRWSLFTLDVAGTAPVPARTGLFLPPSVPGATEGPPVEDVLLVRDEAANMVWGIERTVWLATGAALSGDEAARETLGYRRRLEPPAEPLPPVAPIGYEAMSTVPENWIPFLPTHLPDDDREIQLQRGAMPRFLAGAATERVRPRTTLLRPGLDARQPYFVHEEEVPRVGTRLSVAFHRARWYDGRPVVWLGARRSTGRGEASSGLDWDRIASTS